MNVQPYRGEGPLIVGREDADLESRFHQMRLENGTATWMTPAEHSPLLSPYSVPSPSMSGTLTPNFLHTQHSPTLLGSISPSYTVQHAGNGSLLSPYSPAYPPFGMQTPTWNRFDVSPYGPGTIGQGHHSPLQPLGNFRQHSRSLGRYGGRNVQDYSGGHHNVVDVDRIRKGADVRTTVCCPSSF